MNVTKKIIGSVFVASLLAWFLFSLNISGLLKNPNNTADSQKITDDIPFTTLMNTAQKSLSPSAITYFKQIENQFRTCYSRKDSTDLFRKIGKKWVSLGHPAVASFYAKKIVALAPDYEAYLFEGDCSLAACSSRIDSTYINTFFHQAANAYRLALEKNSSSADATVGLATVYVSTSSDPMQGIKLLLDVVRRFPEHIKANKALGVFSMRSGQFEKAVARFEKIATKTPDVETQFYLAESYKALGRSKEAVAAYRKCQKISGDSLLNQSIEKFIIEIKN